MKLYKKNDIDKMMNRNNLYSPYGNLVAESAERVDEQYFVDYKEKVIGSFIDFDKILEVLTKAIKAQKSDNEDILALKGAKQIRSIKTEIEMKNNKYMFEVEYTCLNGKRAVSSIFLENIKLVPLVGISIHADLIVMNIIPTGK